MKDLNGKKVKHDHTLSNLLKGCILAIVMLAPFFAILSKMIYVSVNKNAKDSYYGETINERQIEYVNLTTYEINKNYVFTSDTINYIPNTNYNRGNTYISFQINEPNSQLPLLQTNTTYYMGVYKVDTWDYNNWAISEVVNGNALYSFTSNETKRVIEMGMVNIVATNDILENTHILGMYTYNKYSYLDNVFYYAIDQSKNEEILNWTKNTPIYNVINSMNTGLGLSANHILTYLLTYWSIILAIYIVFDIIIFVFTKITHYLQ